jgi:hypothetical protein
MLSGSSLSRERESLSARDTPWDIYLDARFLLFSSFSVASATFFTVDFAASLAGVTSHALLKVTEHGLHHFAHCSASLASVTSFFGTPWFAASALADITDGWFTETDGFLDPGHCFFEVNLYVYLDISTGSPTSTASSSATKNPAKEIFKINPLKTTAKIKSAKALTATLAPLTTKRLTILVILGALRFVRQNLIGFVGFFEFHLVPSFFVWVILVSFFSKSLLDLILSSILAYPKGFVIIGWHRHY